MDRPHTQDLPRWQQLVEEYKQHREQKPEKGQTINHEQRNKSGRRNRSIRNQDT